MKRGPRIVGVPLHASTSTQLCLLAAAAISCGHSASKNGADSGGESQTDVATNSDLAVSSDAVVASEAGIPTHGLTLMDRVVYDSNQNVYWLAEANLAGTSEGQTIRTQMNAPSAGIDLSKINPNGTMDFATAKNWVQALNQVVMNGCQGYLCHTDWQLPVTPNDDPTCSERGPAPYHNDFAAWCTGSALGNLHGVGLGLGFSNSVVPGFTSSVGPFLNLQPSLYWTAESDGASGEKTFSFLTGLSGSNTTKYNYFYLLPRLAGAPKSSPPPLGQGVLAYTSGPAAGKAVYDTNTQITWLLDANLAASQDFGVGGTTEVQGNNNCVPSADCDFFEPLVNPSGAMLFDDRATTAWLAGLNSANQTGFAGEKTWALPSVADLKTLSGDLGLPAPALISQASVGPFQHLQPFFYWACVPSDPSGNKDGNARSPCDFTTHAGQNSGGTDMEWSYNFDTGFQATDLNTKKFYVMVYYPGL
jgi:hypothetical protein